MEGKVAVLGSEDFVMPFSALGLESFAATESDESIVEKAKQIVDGHFALVVVAENVAKQAQQIFSTVSKDATPCVVIVPFTTEPQGFAIASLGEDLKLATGINILED